MEQEVHIQWWDCPEDPVDHDKDTFWISTATKSAVGLFWYNHVRNSGKPFPDNLSVTVDRTRGVVVVSDEEGCTFDCDHCHMD